MSRKRTQKNPNQPSRPARRRRAGGPQAAPTRSRAGPDGCGRNRRLRAAYGPPCRKWRCRRADRALPPCIPVDYRGWSGATASARSEPRFYVSVCRTAGVCRTAEIRAFPGCSAELEAVFTMRRSSVRIPTSPFFRSETTADLGCVSVNSDNRRRAGPASRRRGCGFSVGAGPCRLSP